MLHTHLTAAERGGVEAAPAAIVRRRSEEKMCMGEGRGKGTLGRHLRPSSSSSFQGNIKLADETLGSPPPSSAARAVTSPPLFLLLRRRRRLRIPNSRTYMCTPSPSPSSTVRRRRPVAQKSKPLHYSTATILFSPLPQSVIETRCERRRKISSRGWRRRKRKGRVK